MIIKGIKDEDFVNYKKPHMFIGFPSCNWKCEREYGKKICQNSNLAKSPNIEISKFIICKRYLDNPITKAIVCGGLEPFDSFSELLEFIDTLRNLYENTDDIVIYTGYTERECRTRGWIDKLQIYPNIIIKFGRFVPYENPHYDEILGVNLASDNQYARRIS